MANEDQPDWAKRLETKLDAVLMALNQMNFADEIRGNQIAEMFGDKRVNRRNPMEWNHRQAIKVIKQGLDGEKPEYDE